MGSFEFIVDDEQGYLHTKYLGEIYVSDIKNAVVQGNRLYPNHDSLVDFSGGSLKTLGSQEISWLVELAKQHEPHGINCAFVAPRDLEFGFSRMYDMIADADLPQNRAVFRSLADARDWLIKQRSTGSRT